MTAQHSAKIFAGLILVVVAFQLALALGVPWGRIAMGGGTDGVLPPALRWAALAQILLLGLSALTVLVRAGCALPSWRRASRAPVWIVVGLFVVSLLLNLITPSAWERVIWSPVALGLLLTSLHVAWSR